MKKTTLASKGGALLLMESCRIKLCKMGICFTLKGQKFFELWLKLDHFSVLLLSAAIQD